jgi:hypothetical protein
LSVFLFVEVVAYLQLRVNIAYRKTRSELVPCDIVNHNESSES